ncbi:oxidoreductase bli-4, mitochondrial [Colletotrichum truncatum]|uniref:Oxidoreductase bli-4, mitochondrial n=1 Tax=Colletotrichum truncatum TaxID=5467 RepID=A0ACC3YP52_COLTU
MQEVLGKAAGGPQKIEPEDLKGRVAVVTGGALGIGFEISRALAHAGCKVIMVNRKEEHGAEAVSQIKEETSGADVEWKECDLGNLAQVRSVFSEIRESLDRLDFLALSAGINSDQYGEDHDGIDRHFGVNYLGQFYVTNLLWPLIKKTSKSASNPAPRIVFEASEVHRTAPSDVHFACLEEINNPKLGPTQLYGRTKLALILLAKFGLTNNVIKKDKVNVFATSVHPGTVKTGMQDSWKSAYPGVTGYVLSGLMKLIGRSPEQGAYSALWAMTAPEIETEDLGGHYFTDPGQEGKESSQASDPSLGAALWDLSERIIKDKLGGDALLDWHA